MFDSFTFLLVVGGAWLAIGLSLSLVMARRGHDGFGWLVIGALFGPLSLLLALDTARHDEVLGPITVRQAKTAAGAGNADVVDILVGYDGSPESRAAIEAAAEQAGESLGRLTVATVVPYDDIVEAERSARSELQRLAETGDEDVVRVTEFKVLHGRPSEALRQWAEQDGYELIAVGSRGAGLSKRIVGSAASELSEGGRVPVLVVGKQ